MRLRTILALTFVGLLAACGSDSGEEPAEEFAVDIAWTDCTFFTDGTGEPASCATVAVPLDWSDPEGRTIELFLKRLGSTAPERSVWFLAGGPGEATAAYELYADDLLTRHPNMAVYLLDHRGTGRSTRLGCPGEEAEGSTGGSRIVGDEWPLCIASLQAEWSDGLDHFRSRQAATDVGEIIAATNQGEPVHLHSTSYGTYLLNRYLQQYPDQPTSVSGLGIAPPTLVLNDYAQNFEDVGAVLLSKCGADTFCASKLTADPATFVGDVFDNIASYCAAAATAGITRDRLRTFASLVLLLSWSERVLPLAAAYRIQRCNAGDEQALQYFATNVLERLLDGPPLIGPLHSPALAQHISLSEMWLGGETSVEDAQALLDGGLWAGASTLLRAQNQDRWPIYQAEAAADESADFDGPMLLINGELDPATPLAGAQSVAAHFPGAQLLEIPWGVHSLTSPTAAGSNCAIERLWSFVADPSLTVADCSSEIVAPTFESTAALAGGAFGTADLWE
jgi:pimeloyl-ACP methyl ester carboxylesterase